MKCSRKGLYHSEIHWTKYKPGSYIASLCKKCFKQLDVNERLYYYQKTFMEWEKSGMTETWGPWYIIEYAVLSGK